MSQDEKKVVLGYADKGDRESHRKGREQPLKPKAKLVCQGSS
jgi:hypothetical protein